ncbi:YcaO-like family protein [Psychromicrobium lacuslunae]|uniref:YcaO domain-containing protein n=1 Tax=Psychromicrobium lacuslunae TaxID=1618207 RepID=A0A0D4C053_9MICC|nr:YcaO-like family protein [Psychromicrobium lacuslunae]AJT41785.1 hypothetical protein UM93_10115 [Psychromicrobium lacuslunae]
MAQPSPLRAGLIGPDLGLIPAVRTLRVTPGSINAPALVVHPPRLPTLDGPVAAAPSATGFGLGAQKLFGSATGEFIERYSAGIVPPEFPSLAGADQIPAREFLQFTEQQYASESFPYRHPETLPEITYAPAYRAIDNSPVSVPADLSYLTPSSDQLWCTMTSNGLAAGRSFGMATRAAIFELIERDAFMRAWYQRIDAPQLRIPETIPQHFSAELKSICEQLRLLGVSISLVRYIGVAGIPVVLSTARSAEVGLAVGCAAKPTVQEAMVSAFIESVHTYNWARRVLHQEVSINSVDSLADHIALHAKVENRTYNEFLDSGPILSEKQFVSSPRYSLADAIKLTKEAGWDVYFADLRSPDVAANGWHVVRALSPQAATLDVEVPHLAQHPNAKHHIPHPFP